MICRSEFEVDYLGTPSRRLVRLCKRRDLLRPAALLAVCLDGVSGILRRRVDDIVAYVVGTF